jgi:prepilin-type N-terminal cleavage/methylation domain-containing protein
MKYSHTKNNSGFTLVELLVVIAVSVFLASMAYTSIFESRENTKVMDTGLNQKELTRATEAYFRDMGFYPPDVNRGWDPGFEQSLPWNPDGQTGSGVDESTVPSDWEDVVAEKWAGPYLVWPKSTPWGGRYDYNYWPTAETRNGGCVVSKGIYAGAQGYYGDVSGTTVPSSAETKMVAKGFDADGCLNGESQLLLWRL